MERKTGLESVLSIVAPVYNEVTLIESFVAETQASLKRLTWPGRTEIVLVNDGSTDGSGAKMEALCRENADQIRLIHLARNFGHQAAVAAGLSHAKGEVVILMDSDLQDDPAAFALFLSKWREGYDVVVARRESREEGILLRMCFWIYYRIMRSMVRIDLPLDAGNFGLMDRRVVDHLIRFPEHNPYIPGLRAWIGYRQTSVSVARRKRTSGPSHVGFLGLFNLALNAIFSFSYVPIRMFNVAGLIALFMVAILVSWALHDKYIVGVAVPAWTSEMIAIAFFAGINLLGLGTIGEYVFRIFDEVRGRPRYIISETYCPDPAGKEPENS
jgi:polyisoprenyl-phosphate glycosyltransferase